MVFRVGVGKSRKLLAPVAAVVLLGAAVTAAAPAAAQLAPAGGPVLWSAPAAIASHPLNAIACPTISLCVAVDHAGQVFTSTRPASGAIAWQPADVDGTAELTAVACPSSALCVATDGNGNAVTSTDPTGGAGAWSAARIDTSTVQRNSDGSGPALLRGIACPSSALCVAVDADGNALVSSSPASGPAAWSTIHADANSSPGCAQANTSCQPPLMGVACPSTSLCEAVDFSGNVLQTTTPAAASPWASTSLAGGGISSLWAISCPTQTLCMTVDGYGGRVFSWDPAAPGGVRAQSLPYALFGAWCPSASLCLLSASTSRGTSVLLGSGDPLAAGPRWTEIPVGDVNDLACPAVSVCLAVDGAGDVIAGSPTGYLAGALSSQLLSFRRMPTTSALARRGRYLQHFTSPIAARVEVVWSLGSAGGAPLEVAAGGAAFSGPGTRPVAVRLTRAGRSLLRAATGRVRLSATATFETPTGSLRRRQSLTLVPPRRQRRHR
jgi:hypothetical protein